MVFACPARNQGRRDDVVNKTPEVLLQGLAGAADYEKDGSISTAELNLWLTTQVKKLTGNRQNAVMLKPDTVQDFSIARMK